MPSSLDTSVLSRHDATPGKNDRSGGPEGMGELQVGLSGWRETGRKGGFEGGMEGGRARMGVSKQRTALGCTPWCPRVGRSLQPPLLVG